MANRFILNETSYFGAGARESLADEIKARGFKKILFVTDKVLLECGVAKQVTDVMDKASIAYDTYSDIKANPTVKNVQDGDAAFIAVLSGERLICPSETAVNAFF